MSDEVIESVSGRRINLDQNPKLGNKHGVWAIILYDAQPIVTSVHTTAESAIRHMDHGDTIIWLPFDKKLHEAIADWNKENK